MASKSMDAWATLNRRPTASHVFLFLLAFRICNSLLLGTAYSADEYFQALEPAWDFAFGHSSGAWITWEWPRCLRSSLHPWYFALAYRVSNFVARALNCDASQRAELLLAGPKVAQTLIAAAIDYFTWRTAVDHGSSDVRIGNAALALTIISPWQWFYAVRTMSNSLEAALTTCALFYWQRGTSKSHKDQDLRALRVALCLAAMATILRPTNVIIWIVLATYDIWRVESTRLRVSQGKVLFMEAILCGSAMLAVCAVLDRIFYDRWTLPALQFIHVNFIDSIATFYGVSPPQYYLVEALPQLLTTTLPFALIGLWQMLLKKQQSQMFTGRGLALTVLVMLTVLSSIEHKEVRFIYPLLPMMHILAARPAADFFAPPTFGKRCLLAIVLVINVVIAAYAGLVHQRGVIDVTHFLRHEYERDYLPKSLDMTVGFLMPCHSTPWRSHLVHKGIDAWALTCEPPLNMTTLARSTYLDEADIFYTNPGTWLRMTMSNSDGSSGGRPWPQYLVMFQALEPALATYFKDDARLAPVYMRHWRTFNTHVHDDRRRAGDVIVWRSEGTMNQGPH